MPFAPIVTSSFTISLCVASPFDRVRLAAVVAPIFKEAMVTEPTETSTTGGLVSVCFAPESKNAQLGGLGSLMLNPNNSGASVDCGTYTYAAGCGGACYVCVPQ